MGVCISRCLKEELAWDTDKQLQVIIIQPSTKKDKIVVRISSQMAVIMTKI